MPEIESVVSPATRRRPWPAAASAGVVALALALGAAELVAGFVGAGSSPLLAVGDAVVDLTPRPVESWAIRTFGSSDKAVLIIGTLMLLVVLAAVIGTLALRDTTAGVAGVAFIGLVGALAAVTRPDLGFAAAMPSLIGACAGVIVLLFLTERLGPDERAESGAEPAVAPYEIDRRGFVQGTVGSLLLAGAAGWIGRMLAASKTVTEARQALVLPTPTAPAPSVPPGASLKLPGLTPFFTDNQDFYRVDTALGVPYVDPGTWRLRVHGMVRHPITLTYGDLLARPMVERDITLACISNEIGGDLNGNARWLGVLLGPLLDEAGPDPQADQILSTSADGWTCGTSTATCRDGRDAMLAIAMNGYPLPAEHGFPVRMVVPGLYGYESATKWVVDMKLTTFAGESAYWVRRGWAEQTPIKTFSRIDTPRGDGVSRAGRVTVAGIAYAQHRGIDKVEVRVDGGRWQTANLAAEHTVDTWRQWWWKWDATPGEHTLECRATDGTGATQTRRRSDPFPEGATGWHSVRVHIT